MKKETRDDRRARIRRERADELREIRREREERRERRRLKKLIKAGILPSDALPKQEEEAIVEPVPEAARERDVLDEILESAPAEKAGPAPSTPERAEPAEPPMPEAVPAEVPPPGSTLTKKEQKQLRKQEAKNAKAEAKEAKRLAKEQAKAEKKAAKEAKTAAKATAKEEKRRAKEAKRAEKTVPGEAEAVPNAPQHSLSQRMEDQGQAAETAPESAPPEAMAAEAGVPESAPPEPKAGRRDRGKPRRRGKADKANE